jgi:enediyne biosynthesis protein E4
MRHLTFALLLLVVIGCNKSENKKQFTQLDPDDTGIDFINENTETEKSNILTYEYFYNGGGVALGDINNDGLLDVYFSSTIYENKLYLNKGNFEFEDITEQSGTACEVGWKTGVSMVDINADGFLDIYVCRSASPNQDRRKNILLINNGNNTFTDRAKEFNLDDESFSTHAAFFDFDRDNDLDAILLNHSTLDISNSFLITRRNSKNRFPNVGNRFMKNENGKFIDISDSIGVYGPASNYGLGVSLSDVNNDGWIDIYTGCDYTGRDKLLLNDQGKFFIDATDTLSHISKFTMGTDIADINNDGWMDIFSVDMLPEGNRRQKQLFGSDRYDVYLNMVNNGLHSQYMRNMLHLNNGNGTFSEIGQLAGISNTDWSWGALFADYDNDGVQDLFITNGFKRDLTDNDFAKFKVAEELKVGQRQGKNVSFLEVINKLHENKIPNYSFQGLGNLQFKNVTKEWGLDGASLTNGVAYGDLDNDGDLDLVTNNINDPAGVYRNNANEFSKNSYLKIKLSGKQGNTQALGAKVTLFANGKMFVKENLPARGFQSSVDPSLHFGLGSVTVADSIVVQWPDGSVQHLRNLSVNKTINIKQEGTTPRKIALEHEATYFVNASPPALTFTHKENEFVDFRVQALIQRMYSREGPAVAAADVNGDNVEDVFIGAAKEQSDELWLGRKDGTFSKQNLKTFDNNIQGESTDATFFDADGDSDLDLYVVTGGYEFSENDPLLQDKLYLNNGRGNFKPAALPEINSSGSCVIAADIDKDGDQDLFVGGKIIPGRYPESPESILLINDGKGRFSADKNIPQSLREAGMVSDAVWDDLNNDSFPDLLVVGEWMAVKVFLNDMGVLKDASQDFIQAKTEGLWNSILAHDFDGDGDKDFIIGNQGLNTQMRASEKQPVTLVYDDFDNNGSIDPILNYYIMGESYPYPTRDELTEQLPSFKKRFTDYKSYADAKIEKVLTPEELEKARKISVMMLESVYVRNDNGKLVFSPMPVEMQMSPVMSLAVIDVDGDGIEDVVTGGNISSARARTGKMTGNFGFCFRNDGKGNFSFIPPAISGINVNGDVRKIITLENSLIFGLNDGAVHVFNRSMNRTLVSLKAK